MRIARISALLVIAWTIGACAQKPAPETPKAQDWPAFVQQFVDSFMEAHPMMAFTAGRKEYAGRFPDWSAQGIAAEIARLK
jgi:hypothetical protein